MPYQIEKRGDKYCVITQGKPTHVHGCHKTRAQAVGQLKAIYANAPPEDEGKPKKEK